VTVVSNDASGYSLTVHRAAFLPADLPLGIAGIAPAGGQIGGSLAGLLGAILALPVTAAMRDVGRYLFRRLSPDEPEALAASIDGLGLEVDPGVPSLTTS